MGWKDRASRAIAAVIVLAVSSMSTGSAAARPTESAAPRRAASPPIGDIPDLGGSGYGWQQVFNDDFGGTSVNENVWDLWERDYFAPMVRNAVGVSGGYLTLTTYTDPADGVTKSGALSTGWTASDWPQASDGFRAAYGYIESRIEVGDKAPGDDPSKPKEERENGTTDAFWLMSDNGNNSMPFGDMAADGPEIDIMEHGNGPDTVGDYDGDGRCDWNVQYTALGVPCNETLSDGAHWDGFQEDHKVFDDGPVENPTTTPLTNNFHDYGLLWTPTEYRFYVDGKETRRTPIIASFNPAHMILTAVPGAGNYGPLGDSANDHMVVDYVRVWQRPISDVPDQHTAANTPLTVPFTVTDHTYNDPTMSDPGSVAVSASSSNTTLVPSSGLAVAGNGPSDPDGSFQNGGLESGTGWSLTGAGTVISSTKKHTGSNSLFLPKTGGTATQTITGLSPNTTYVIDANYELDLPYTDSNGNGRIDPSESFTGTNHRPTIKWGVADVDSALAGNQPMTNTFTREGEQEQAKPSYWVREPWQQEMLKFTTGPTTTSVSFVVDNTPFVGGNNASDAWFDSVVVRALVPAPRTLTVRPADGQVGQSTITLTATNAAGGTIGTDTFVVTVGAGSLTDGAFETGAATTPWVIGSGSPQITAANVFKPDAQLVLASSAPDTVFQSVTGLTASTRYKLDVTGRVSQSGGSVVLAVDSYGGSQVTNTITTTSSSTQSVEFVTGAANTSASVILLDWVPADGTSAIEKVNLSRCTTTSSCASLSTTVPATPPPALSATPRSTVSNAPVAIPVALPSGATLTSVTSTNQVLVPNIDVTVVTSGTNGLHKVVTASPLPDRTGATKLRVAFTGAAGSPVDIPLTVSDRGLVQPGFEKGGQGWTAGGTASFVTSGQRSGSSALQIGSGTGSVTQNVGGLPHGTDYTLGGWVDGSVTVTVKTVPVATCPPPQSCEQAETLGTATWTGSGWTESKLPFRTLLVTDGGLAEWRPVQIVISDASGTGGKVDDLYLVHRPVIRRMRDLSLHSAQTTPDWNTHRDVVYGRAAENAQWDTSAFTFTSTDLSGFGTGVVPASNLSPLESTNTAWPYQTILEARAGTKTGRSLITVKLTDPATGNFTTRDYDVTVNAGDSFNNGDFERSSFGGPNTQWGHAWLNDSVDIRSEQGWSYLGIHDGRWSYVGPRDDDKVLRISSGIAGATLITGLTPSTSYEVRLRAKGSGSTVQVRTHQNVVFAPTLGSVAISPPNSDNVWRDYAISFTTTATGNGSTSVALYIADADTSDRNGDGLTNAADAISASDRACAIFHTGESCVDDIGLFKASDVP